MAALSLWHAAPWGEFVRADYPSASLSRANTPAAQLPVIVPPGSLKFESRSQSDVQQRFADSAALQQGVQSAHQRPVTAGLAQANDVSNSAVPAPRSHGPVREPLRVVNRYAVSPRSEIATPGGSTASAEAAHRQVTGDIPRRVVGRPVIGDVRAVAAEAELPNAQSQAPLARPQQVPTTERLPDTRDFERMAYATPRTGNELDARLRAPEPASEQAFRLREELVRQPFTAPVWDAGVMDEPAVGPVLGAPAPSMANSAPGPSVVTEQSDLRWRQEEAPQVPPVVPRNVPSEPAATAPTKMVQPHRIRTVELEQVAQRADAHTRRGFQFLGRQAYLSAQSEFVAALRLMSEALDAQDNSATHGRALAAGLRALEESDDFIPRGGALEAELDIRQLASGHRTPALQDYQGEPTALAARQLYYTYAIGQFTEAAEHEVASAMALYGLGRLYTVMGDRGTTTVLAPEPKSLAFHQAALAADPNHALAANELGVLLSRYGRYPEARDLLQHSLRLQPQDYVWNNLAAVHLQLHERELAHAARFEARRLRAAGHRAAPAQVDAVAPEQFMRAGPPSTDAHVATAAVQRPESAGDQEKRSSSWWDWNKK